MSAIPIVRIELQGMKQAILHAFTEEQLITDEQFKIALTQAVERFDFIGEVRVEANKVIREEIESAVHLAIWELMRDKAVVKEIRAAVKRMMLANLEDPR